MSLRNANLSKVRTRQRAAMLREQRIPQVQVLAHILQDARVDLVEFQEGLGRPVPAPSSHPADRRETIEKDVEGPVEAGEPLLTPLRGGRQ